MSLESVAVTGGTGNLGPTVVAHLRATASSNCSRGTSPRVVYTSGRNVGERPAGHRPRSKSSRRPRGRRRVRPRGIGDLLDRLGFDYSSTTGVTSSRRRCWATCSVTSAARTVSRSGFPSSSST
ncbi:hypothetical protein C9J85_09405 [Haloferax sp. wsp5]|nr:hypothetical protein C9J85_09405 [Haloferax sp. wsp5]